MTSADNRRGMHAYQTNYLAANVMFRTCEQQGTAHNQIPAPNKCIFPADDLSRRPIVFLFLG